MKTSLNSHDRQRPFDRQLPVFNIFYPSQVDGVEGDIPVDTIAAFGTRDLSRSKSVALYFHFPFCETICNFCPFTRGRYGDHGIISDYLKALGVEIDLKSRVQDLKALKVSAIFVGGGTPSLLTHEEIVLFGSILARHFDLTHLREFSFECEVKSVTEDKVKALRSIGVTNARFGLQTFDPYWREMFDLTATLSQVGSASDLFQKYIKNTSFDILYAMNGHSFSQFEADLKRAVAVGNDLIDVYPIDNVVTQVRLHDKTRRAGLPPLSADTRAEMNDFLRASMHDKGFLPHNGHGYVRSAPEDLQRNPVVTRSYTFEYHNHVYGYGDHIVIGFGVNAISLLQGCVLSNTNNRKDYVNDLLIDGTLVGQMSHHGPDIDASRPLVTRLAYHGHVEKSRIDLATAPAETISALDSLSKASPHRGDGSGDSADARRLALVRQHHVPLHAGVATQAAQRLHRPQAFPEGA